MANRTVKSWRAGHTYGDIIKALSTLTFPKDYVFTRGMQNQFIFSALAKSLELPQTDMQKRRRAVQDKLRYLAPLLMHLSMEEFHGICADAELVPEEKASFKEFLDKHGATPSEATNSDAQKILPGENFLLPSSSAKSRGSDDDDSFGSPVQLATPRGPGSDQIFAPSSGPDLKSGHQCPTKSHILPEVSKAVKPKVGLCATQPSLLDSPVQPSSCLPPTKLHPAADDKASLSAAKETGASSSSSCDLKPNAASDTTSSKEIVIFERAERPPDAESELSYASSGSEDSFQYSKRREKEQNAAYEQWLNNLPEEQREVLGLGRKGPDLAAEPKDLEAVLEAMEKEKDRQSSFVHERRIMEQETLTKRFLALKERFSQETVSGSYAKTKATSNRSRNAKARNLLVRSSDESASDDDAASGPRAGTLRSGKSRRRVISTSESEDSIFSDETSDKHKAHLMKPCVVRVHRLPSDRPEPKVNLPQEVLSHDSSESLASTKHSEQADKVHNTAPICVAAALQNAQRTSVVDADCDDPLISEICDMSRGEAFVRYVLENPECASDPSVQQQFDADYAKLTVEGLERVTKFLAQIEAEKSQARDEPSASQPGPSSDKTASVASMTEKTQQVTKDGQRIQREIRIGPGSPKQWTL